MMLNNKNTLSLFEVTHVKQLASDHKLALAVVAKIANCEHMMQELAKSNADLCEQILALASKHKEFSEPNTVPTIKTPW